MAISRTFCEILRSESPPTGRDLPPRSVWPMVGMTGVKGTTERIVDRIIGSGTVSAAARFPTRHRVRILAYHAVTDEETFAQQMLHLRTAYQPVSAALVVDAFRGIEQLPEDAVWVTFDDGSPSVVERALPYLLRYEIPSTLFVCPSVVDTDTPFWWQTVEQAWACQGCRPSDAEKNGNADSYTAALKTMPDLERRERVVRMAEDLMRLRGLRASAPQITNRQLEQYVSAGGTLGNHTWDHPCLDQCGDQAVTEQISQAHQEIEKKLGIRAELFAYPNGSHSPQVEVVLERLEYAIGLLFDHRIARVDQPPLRVSRLRVNDHTNLARYRAILSGAHPVLHHARARWTVRNPN